MNTPKILCMFAAPLVNDDGEPLVLLDVERERNVILDVLRTSNREGEIAFTTATTQNLMDSVTADFTILHYSGHGTPNHLAFEDGRGGIQLTDVTLLSNAVRMSTSIRLALVSACYSENVARCLIEGGIKHVIAIKDSEPVLNYSAIVFAKSFFQFLLSGKSVNFSYNMAKMVVSTDPNLVKLKQHLEQQAALLGETYVPEESKFILLPSDPSTAVHEEVLFPARPSGVFCDITSRCVSTSLPPFTPTFVGRTRDIYKIVNLIMDERLVSIIGAPGIGKTALSTAAGRWLLARGLFPDGIHLVDLRGAISSDQVFATVRVGLKWEPPTVGAISSQHRDKNFLLIFDNLETALRKDPAKVRQLISDLLSSLPRLHLLITSQEAIAGVIDPPEKEYRLGAISNDETMLLLHKVSPRFFSADELSGPDFKSVFEIIRGHPLSTILVARQLRTNVTFRDVLEQVERNGVAAIRAPGGSQSDLPSEESLQSSIKGAYAMCSLEAQKCMALLSFLPTGIWQENVRHLLNEIPDAKRALMELVERGLAERAVLPNTRYYLLPPIQLYAISTLPDEDKRREEAKLFKFFLNLLRYIGVNWEEGNASSVQALFFDELPNLLRMLSLDLPSDFEEAYELFVVILCEVLHHAGNYNLVLRTLNDLDRRDSDTIKNSFSLSKVLGAVYMRKYRYSEAEEILRHVVDAGSIEQWYQFHAGERLTHCLILQDKLQLSYNLVQRLVAVEKHRTAIDGCLEAAAEILFLTDGKLKLILDETDLLDDTNIFEPSNFFAQGLRWYIKGLMSLQCRDYDLAYRQLEIAFDEMGKINQANYLGKLDCLLALVEFVKERPDECRKRLERAENYFKSVDVLEGLRTVAIASAILSNPEQQAQIDEQYTKVREITRKVRACYWAIRYVEHMLEHIQATGDQNRAAVATRLRGIAEHELPEDLAQFT